MNITEVAAALGAPANESVTTALSTLTTYSGLAPADLVGKLYEPANREVLDLLRAGTNAGTIIAAYERLNPVEASPTLVAASVPAPPDPVAQEVAAQAVADFAPAEAVPAAEAAEAPKPQETIEAATSTEEAPGSAEPEVEAAEAPKASWGERMSAILSQLKALLDEAQVK
jgi:hypothetical protein